jgi:hypothetical protein
MTPKIGLYCVLIAANQRVLADDRDQVVQVVNVEVLQRVRHAQSASGLCSLIVMATSLPAMRSTSTFGRVLYSGSGIDFTNPVRLVDRVDHRHRTDLPHVR